MSLSNLNTWWNEWLVVINTLQERDYKGGKGKGRKNKRDLIYEQYSNTCKLGANWDEQDFNAN